jgi:hypothetical protein
VKNEQVISTGLSLWVWPFTDKPSLANPPAMVPNMSAAELENSLVPTARSVG